MLNEIKAISKMLQCLWLGLRFLHSFEKDWKKKKIRVQKALSAILVWTEERLKSLQLAAWKFKL